MAKARKKASKRRPGTRPETRLEIVRQELKALEAEDRQWKALRLRLEGQTLREIAKRLGYSGPSEAHEVIRRARQLLPREDVVEARTLLAERLESATAAVMPRALTGDLQAIMTLVKLCGRMARLLGLDRNADSPIDVPVGRLRLGRPAGDQQTRSAIEPIGSDEVERINRH